MRIVINEYTPIRSLLNIAVTEYETYHDHYIEIMVRDAISLSQNQHHKINANRRMYRYSSYLSRHCSVEIQRMDPQRLTLDNYKTLLRIFSNL